MTEFICSGFVAISCFPVNPFAFRSPEKLCHLPIFRTENRPVFIVILFTSLVCALAKRG